MSAPATLSERLSFTFKLFFGGNKEYINLVCMVVMWSNKAIVASRFFLISTFFLKNYSTSFIVIDLSFSLASFKVVFLEPNPALSKYMFPMIFCLLIIISLRLLF